MRDTLRPNGGWFSNKLSGLGALGRVVFLDVWQLALVYRVLSFMALGIALIVLGYVYNRWQDKIREWL